VSSSTRFLSPSEAAGRLGVSAKALRLYEQRGLVAPVRTAAGWRAYGPGEMARAAEIVALRALGLSLAQVARVLEGDPQDLEPALATHQSRLEEQARHLGDAIGRVRSLRTDLARGHVPRACEISDLTDPSASPGIAFDLPWPWGGERFELRDIRLLTYITGPLGSGKTRLARRLAETIPGAAFLGLERLEEGAETQARLDADPALRSRVDRALAWLLGEGATLSGALIALLVGIEAEGVGILVVDMVEQGLDQPTQAALMAYLRRPEGHRRPLFLLTRSCAILDLSIVGLDETILYCPANHSPPIRVAPYPGTPGYEAVATCLASPEARARMQGVVAMRSRCEASQ
jgi:DNA-binding transcriptional MerR regulator